MKAHISSKVWFPDINAAVESALHGCTPCQVNSNHYEYEPLNMSDLPKDLWLHLSMDFCGLLPSGDYHWWVLQISCCGNCSMWKAIIPTVDKVFALFGYPSVVNTDNGPQFKSALWKSFVKSYGIKHRRITPLWPKLKLRVSISLWWKLFTQLMCNTKVASKICTNFIECTEWFHIVLLSTHHVISSLVMNPRPNCLRYNPLLIQLMQK